MPTMCALTERPYDDASGSGSRSGGRGGEDAGTAGDGSGGGGRESAGTGTPRAGTPNDRSRETDAFTFAFEENTGGVCGAATSGSVDETRCAATTPPPSFFAPRRFFPRSSFSSSSSSALHSSRVSFGASAGSRAVAAGGTDASLATADGSSRLFVPFNFAGSDPVAEEPERSVARAEDRTESRLPFLPFLPLNAFSSSSSSALHSSSAIARGDGPAPLRAAGGDARVRASRCAVREGAAVRKGVSSSQHLGRGVPKVQVGGIKNPGVMTRRDPETKRTVDGSPKTPAKAYRSDLWRVMAFARRLVIPARLLFAARGACGTPCDVFAGRYRAWASGGEVETRARKPANENAASVTSNETRGASRTRRDPSTRTMTAVLTPPSL